jgi:hypothetical protein
MDREGNSNFGFSAANIIRAAPIDTKSATAMLSFKTFHSAPQPNCRFNADANIGHAFGIFMAYVGTLRTSCSGAG